LHSVKKLVVLLHVKGVPKKLQRRKRGELKFFAKTLSLGV